MRDKLKKLEEVLRGDNDPKWIAVYGLLNEITNKLEHEPIFEQKKTTEKDNEFKFNLTDEFLKRIKDMEVRSDKLISKINKFLTKFDG